MMKGKRLKREIVKCKKEFMRGNESNPWMRLICEKAINWCRVINAPRKAR